MPEHFAPLATTLGQSPEPCPCPTAPCGTGASTGPSRSWSAPIVLTDWQREIVTAHPGDFLRGLWALDLLGVAWRMNRRNSLSVARREAVAALDRHVGPKP
ncbi:hypothetical protein [Micromonospora sp. NPDC023633]|uniref:hypothetical protein n=1 Tax=Micromonospora sp. NPDC023633 TaxID=3154320 RepID=UPI0033C8BF18